MFGCMFTAIIMAEKKAKESSKHAVVQIWTKYKDGKMQGRWCPRCGTGTFLGVHKDRAHCGKCGYAEIKK